MTKNYVLKHNSIDLIVYDFDGVMTDNKLLVFQDGKEAAVVNRTDGLGIDILKKLEIPQIILSTETNPVVATRAKKVGLPVLQGIEDKKKTLVNYCRQHGFNLEKVLYIGNDINDGEVMKTVGIPIAPADAHKEILQLAKVVLKSKGGEGVVRELADYIANVDKNKKIKIR
jgi:YrbI family 3-deoxy-D-manno-octulosonate 8-phosphate phosphatase